MICKVDAILFKIVLFDYPFKHLLLSRNVKEVEDRNLQNS